jgi:hypothetical protein
MPLPIWPAIDRGKFYVFPAVWVAVLTAGVAIHQPVSPVDATTFLSFNTQGYTPGEETQPPVPPMHADTAAPATSAVAVTAASPPRVTPFVARFSSSRSTRAPPTSSRASCAKRPSH